MIQIVLTLDADVPACPRCGSVATQIEGRLWCGSWCCNAFFRRSSSRWVLVPELSGPLSPCAGCGCGRTGGYLEADHPAKEAALEAWFHARRDAPGGPLSDERGRVKG